jgi:hypothetical protein
MVEVFEDTILRGAEGELEVDKSQEFPGALSCPMTRIIRGLF